MLPLSVAPFGTEPVIAHKSRLNRLLKRNIWGALYPSIQRWQNILNSAPSYVVFSRAECVCGKASKRRCSRSTA